MLQPRAPEYIFGIYRHQTILLCIWFPCFMTCPTLLEVKTNRARSMLMTNMNERKAHLRLQRRERTTSEVVKYCSGSMGNTLKPTLFSCQRG